MEALAAEGDALPVHSGGGAAGQLAGEVTNARIECAAAAFYA